MKNHMNIQGRLSELALQVMHERQEGKKIDEAHIKEMWQLATEAITEGIPIGSEWLALGCMTFGQFVSIINNPPKMDPRWISRLLSKHCSENSQFSQSLWHNHSVDDPPLASNSVFGDVGPDRWGYLYKDPTHRWWLPWPTQPIPTGGASWTNYGFSWIYACKTDLQCVPDTKGGRTQLCAKFEMDLQLDHNGVACVRVTSRASMIGYGSYAWVNPIAGFFSANHGLCISLDPTGVAPPWNRSVHHDSREVWQVAFDPAHPNEHTWIGGNAPSYGPPLGGRDSSEVSIVVPVKGPTSIHVTEEITYIVSLTEGGFRCPFYPDLLGVNPGLFGVLDPLCWQLEDPCSK